MKRILVILTVILGLVVSKSSAKDYTKVDGKQIEELSKLIPTINFVSPKKKSLFCAKKSKTRERRVDLKALKKFKKLLSKAKNEKVNINTPIIEDLTLLFKACENNQLEIVKLLLKYPEIDVNAYSWEEETPLSVACQNNYIKIIEELLNHPDIDASKSGDLTGMKMLRDQKKV